MKLAHATAILGIALMAVTPSVPWAMNGGEGLAGTPHDFTGNATSSAKGGPGLCIYCHTPQTSGGAPLIWNHTLSKNFFRWDAGSTTAGTPLTGFDGNAYKGTSAKCLSCHDGSVAVGDIGVFGNQSDAGMTSSADRLNRIATKYEIGAGGNLSGNHPVAVPYPLGRTPNTYNGSTNGGGSMLFASNEWQVNPIASPTASIRLYRDDGAGNISALTPGAMTNNAGIECSSCHDPHNRASVDVMFLRGKLAGRSQADGYLCEQCHNL